MPNCTYVHPARGSAKLSGYRPLSKRVQGGAQRLGGLGMLFMHEVHKVRGRAEDEFEAAFREGWMP
ncbi:MAG: hypothetical protein ACRDSX_04290, partial [Mycobacterium sp.]